MHYYLFTIDVHNCDGSLVQSNQSHILCIHSLQPNSERLIHTLNYLVIQDLHSHCPSPSSFLTVTEINCQVLRYEVNIACVAEK